VRKPLAKVKGMRSFSCNLRPDENFFDFLTGDPFLGPFDERSAYAAALVLLGNDEATFFMNPAYRFPRHAVPPGAPANPADLEVIEAMPVKSYITGHEDGARVPLGPVTLRGIAWAGEERLKKVEISTDSGVNWREASLSSKDLAFTWRLWTLGWMPPGPGYYTVLSRATDAAGRVRPMIAIWNPSGYLFNAIDRVGLLVEAQ
jgi:Mo-co oxidoreductase dimerisation domain